MFTVSWYERLSGDDNPLADAIMDRIVYDVYKINIVSIDPSDFEKMIVKSDAIIQFESGNPAYVCGINGCELARKVITQSGYSFKDKPDEMYMDKSPEYRCGWILAYYQWFTDRHFTVRAC